MAHKVEVEITSKRWRRMVKIAVPQSERQGGRVRERERERKKHCEFLTNSCWNRKKWSKNGVVTVSFNFMLFLVKLIHKTQAILRVSLQTLCVSLFRGIGSGQCAKSRC